MELFFRYLAEAMAAGVLLAIVVIGLGMLYVAILEWTDSMH